MITVSCDICERTICSKVTVSDIATQFDKPVDSADLPSQFFSHICQKCKDVE